MVIETEPNRKGEQPRVETLLANIYHADISVELTSHIESLAHDCLVLSSPVDVNMYI